MKKRSSLIPIQALLLIGLFSLLALATGPTLVHNATWQDPQNANGQPITNAPGIWAGSNTNGAPLYDGLSTNGYTALTPPSSNSTNTVPIAGFSTVVQETLPAGTSPYTNSLVLSTNGIYPTYQAHVAIAWPASTNATVNVYSGSANGTPLKSLTSTVNGGNSSLDFHATSTNTWTEFPKGELPARNANLPNGPAQLDGTGKLPPSTIPNNSAQAGSIAGFSAGSGTITVNGVTYTLPSTSDTLAGLAQNNTWTGNQTFNGTVTFGGSSTLTGTIQLRSGSGSYGGTLSAGEMYFDYTNGNLYDGTGSSGIPASTNLLIGGNTFLRGVTPTAASGTSSSGGTVGAAGTALNTVIITPGASGNNSSSTGGTSGAGGSVSSALVKRVAGAGGSVAAGATGGTAGAGSPLPQPLIVEYGGNGGSLISTTTTGNGGAGGYCQSPTAPLIELVHGTGGNAGTTGNGGSGGDYPYGGTYIYFGNGNGSNANGTINGTAGGGFLAYAIGIMAGNGGSAGTGAVGGYGGSISNSVIAAYAGNGGAGGSTYTGGNGGGTGYFIANGGAGGAGTGSGNGATGGSAGYIDVSGGAASTTTLGPPGGSMSLAGLGNQVTAFGGGIFSLKTPVTVANTTTATTLIGTGYIPGSGSGSMPLTTSTPTLNGNALVAGAAYHVHAVGYYSDTGTPTGTLTLLLGGVTLDATSAVTLGSSVTNQQWTMDGDFVCQSVGTSGTVEAQGVASFNGTIVPIVNTATDTINTTTTNAINLTWTWSAASSSNTATCTNLVITRMF